MSGIVLRVFTCTDFNPALQQPYEVHYFHIYLIHKKSEAQRSYLSKVHSQSSGRAETQTPVDDSKAHAHGSLSTQKCISNSYVYQKLPNFYEITQKNTLVGTSTAY